MTRRKDAFNPDTGQIPTHLPNISLDCTIFGFHEKRLKVMLNRFLKFDKWMLPGGFIRCDENLEDAVNRVLEIRTGLKDVFLKQFAVFGELNRVDPEENKHLYTSIGIDPNRGAWLLHRFMTIAYYAFVKYEKAHYRIDKQSVEEEVAWFDIEELPPLYGDHLNIIQTAIQSIRLQLGYIPIGYELLPPKFTMPELRIIYEAILGKELDRRNFQRKILSIGCVYPLNEIRKEGAHKSPNLYAFNAEKYKAAKEEGFLSALANM